MVTGGTGFIGYHTARALAAAGHQVRLLVRDKDKLRRLYGSDITDYVLGDITGHGSDCETSPVAASIALLQRSYRFDPNSGVGKLAALVNQGDSVRAIECLQEENTNLAWYDSNADQIDATGRWVPSTLSRRAS